MAAVPDTVQLKKWYAQDVAVGLAGMFADIETTSDRDSKLLKQFCFSSILLKVCRETRHWGYVCDNTAPRENPRRNVAEILQRTIDDIVVGLPDPIANAHPVTRPEVVEEQAANICQVIAPESVDLVVTSPPYFGVVDYVKSQRLSFEWFGFDLEQRRQAEMGARSKRHRRQAAAEFTQQLNASFGAIVDVMKPGAACAVVFGVSPTRTFSFENLAAIFEEAGLFLHSGHARDVSLQRALKPSVLTERLYILTKPT